MMDFEPDEHYKPKRRRNFKKFLLILITLIIIVGLAAAGWLFIKDRDSGPLPKSIRQSVKFPLYYPSPLPVGYSLDKNSIKSANSIIFFNLNSATNTINISEQAAPANPPDFAALQRSNTSFKKLDVVGGQAVYGVSQKVPVAFLITNTTLINVNGAKNTPVDVIAKTVQYMSSSF